MAGVIYANLVTSADLTAWMQNAISSPVASCDQWNYALNAKVPDYIAVARECLGFGECAGPCGCPGWLPANTYQLLQPVTADQYLTQLRKFEQGTLPPAMTSGTVGNGVVAQTINSAPDLPPGVGASAAGPGAAAATTGAGSTTQPDNTTLYIGIGIAAAVLLLFVLRKKHA